MEHPTCTNCTSIHHAKHHPEKFSNRAIHQITTKQDLSGYFHACAFSTSHSTFLHTIQWGHFVPWYGLTTYLISRHIIKSISTMKGHLRMSQKKVLNQNQHPTTTRQFPQHHPILRRTKYLHQHHLFLTHHNQKPTEIILRSNRKTPSPIFLRSQPNICLLWLRLQQSPLQYPQ